jgi:hypothetical protein
MADICIIYAREDERAARALSEFLGARWTVWWDYDIVGDFAAEIEAEIPKACCVVPLWSTATRPKANVRDELELARRAGKPILPVRLDDAVAPYGFGNESAVDLRGWTGVASDHPGLRQLQHRIARVVAPRQVPRRPSALANGAVELPALFLSVSSYETRLSPLDAVRALRLFGARTILVSAYDLLPRRRPGRLIRELARFRRQGGFVLLDSGNYEATRRQDRSWRTTSLKAALAGAPLDWACSFDVLRPAQSEDDAALEVIAAVERDQTFTDAPIVPIVHAPQRRGGGYAVAQLPSIVRAVAERLAPPMVAIPERELGPGLAERAQTVRRVRCELDRLPFYQPLHLLGTGNPWTIAVLAAAGADSFDGLEWCRVAADAQTHTLHHFQHFEFFAWQAREAVSEVTRAALDDPAIDYAGKVAFHNLEYFDTFERRLRERAREGRLEAFVTGVMGGENADELLRRCPELFR